MVVDDGDVALGAVPRGDHWSMWEELEIPPRANSVQQMAEELHDRLRFRQAAPLLLTELYAFDPLANH